MDRTPTLEHFDRSYRAGDPPWVIGEPQPAVVALVRAGMIEGTVLDVGCGTGEHTLLLAGAGHDVLGVDGSVVAVERAAAAAGARGIDARFAVGDAFALPVPARFDTVLDSALFHIFDEVDRARYARSVHRVLRPGGTLHLLALADDGPRWGPVVAASVIRRTFTDGWVIEELRRDAYRGVVGEGRSAELGVPAGETVDVPAWLARIRRV